MVWHLFFFTGPCRSIESQQDCEEHGIVMESDWQWRSRGLVAFGLLCQGKFQLKTKEKIRYCLILVWNHFSSFTSCRKPPLSHFRFASIPCQRVLEDPLAQQLNTCPTPLMSYKSRTSIVHHDSIFIRPFRNLEPQTPVPNTRLLPLQGRCKSMTSWCSSCWLSMLWRGPEDDKDGKPFQAWEFTMRSATIIYSHVHHQTFEAKITSRSQC